MQAETGQDASELQRLRRRNAELQHEVARLKASLVSAGQSHDAKPHRSVLRPHAADDVRNDSKTHEELILESAIDFAIFTTSSEGVVTSWNEGARRIFGWSITEISGRSARLLYTRGPRGRRC
jgi:PAS domain-containing protein